MSGKVFLVGDKWGKVLLNVAKVSYIYTQR